MQRILIFFVLFILFNIGISKNINFKHLTIQEGVSQSTINCIFQDSHGYMWFGTQDGLNKYDGYKFTIYRPELNDEYSLNAIDILSITEDTLNFPSSLWIGTHGGGLNRFDLRNEKFVSYTADIGLSNNRIDYVFIDKNGIIWLATAGGGLNQLNFGNPKNKLLNPQVKIYSSVENNSSTLSDNYVSCVIADPDQPENILWIGTYKGLNRFDKKTRKVSRFYNRINHHYDQNNKIRCINPININNSNYLMIGTAGGIFLFDLRINKFSNLNSNFKITNDVFYILNENQNNYWIGTYNGLYQLNLLKNDQWNLENHFIHNPVNQSSLSNDHILFLLMDNSNTLWIGTHGNGLNLYDKNASKFYSYNTDSKSSIILKDKNIKSIYEDNNEDAIWIGSHSGGLIKHNYQSDNTNYYSTNNFLKYNRIQTIEQESDGNLWLGGFIGGLQKFNPKTGECVQYLHNPFEVNSISNNNVNSTLIDNKSRLWVGTYGGGINLFNKNDKNFIRFKNIPSDSMSISSDMTRVIFQDSDGLIWIGSEGGLSLVVENKNGITFKNINLGKNLSGFHVFAICEVLTKKIKTLWIGTEGDGIISYTPSVNKIKHFTTADGLPNNVIYSIEHDLIGNLWIGSNFGLSKFSLTDSTFTNFTEEDGLQSNEFNLGASCLKRDGELLFGGINGINTFFPNDIKQNRFQAPIVITDFRIFNDPVSIGSSILNQSLYYTKSIELPFSKNIFSFEFSALHYYKSEKNKYAYSLQGFEDKWNYINSDRRYVTYTNLDPGNYVFKVKATNNDGIWNPKAKQINIIIHPPFWQQWWFRISVFLVMAGILYMIHRYRLHRLLEIEKLRVRIASDLHDDIGSALTRISVHSEMIQNSEEKKTVKLSSKKIGLMSREIITTMSDIVWSIDARNDQMKNLIDRMKDFSTSLLVERDIELKFNYKGLDLNKKLPIDIRQNLFLIFKESINNIYKHSKATSVNVSLINSPNDFIMEIVDNGEGYDPLDIKTGSGLKNMKMRAERIGAEIEIQSNEGVAIILSMKKL